MDPNVALMKAVESGDRFAVAEALGRGADARIRSFHDRPLLEEAEKRQFNFLVELLVGNGADPDERINVLGDSLLHRCCRTNNYGFAIELLAHGADCELENRAGHRPLFLAISKGNLFLAKALLERAADPNGQTSKQETPLHVACKNGDIDAVRMLVKHGAMVDIPDHRGRTPLSLAATKGNAEMLAVMIKPEHFCEDARRQRALQRARAAANLAAHSDCIALIESELEYPLFRSEALPDSKLSKGVER